MDPTFEAYLERERAALLGELSARISDARIVRAFAEVRRELFVPEALVVRAYDDRALPIGEDQTISQPTMVAIMLEALSPRTGDRALEIGSGCGYAAAVLSRLVASVHGVELLPVLAERSRTTLARAGIDNVQIHVGDGTLGLPEWAPYDRILVSAGARSVPEELERELAPGGRIVIPVGGPDEQRLRVGQRVASGIEWQSDVPCVFVPLVGS